MHSNAPAPWDIIRAKAQQMVRAGRANNFSHALSILAKHAAKSRKARRARTSRQQRATNTNGYWWQNN